ncbi:unnamed protein product [Rhizophagus irregularis]|nr:unnamed protein product [Rhizophagus irregularis]CAB5371058.1 unnamed protein product [Rhizophagus irregularis]
MWPEKPTFENESDINVARSKAKNFFQAYRCNLNNDLSQYANIVIERYNKEKALSFHIGEKLNGNHNHEETLHKIKGLDHITKDLVLKSRLYTDVINDI